MSLITIQLQLAAVASCIVGSLLYGKPYFQFRRFRAGDPVTAVSLVARGAMLLGIALFALGLWHQLSSDWHLF
jgi:hypothetical protein